MLFKNNQKSHVAVSYTKAYYTNNPSATSCCLNSVDIKELLNIILSESYATFGGTTFKQINGIPMGSSCSPLLADLTLATMEYKYLLKNSDQDC